MSNVPPMPLGVVEWPSAAPAVIEVPAGGGGGGAPTNAQYVTLATNATLTNERVLTAGTGISLTDSGAGGTITIDATGAGGSTLAAIDFGTGKGETSATVAVTGQTWVTPTSAIVVTVLGTRAEDAAVEGLTFAVGDVVDGDGFTVYGSSPLGSVGSYILSCVGV
jgi:hypothetical protein